ncbi:hypothetical protein [Paraglaciecola sp. 25GB23A]|uniref:hypothetical protein n=1 Tax=Paraglaciecola sp. 25GB23A TaxID=3156068 RepID=UPI0032AF1735
MNKIEHHRILFNSLVFTNTRQDIAGSPYWPKVLVTPSFNKINHTMTLVSEIDKSQAISEDLAAKVKLPSPHTMSKLFTANMRVLSSMRVSKHD